MSLKLAIPNKGRLCEGTISLLGKIGFRVAGLLDRTLVAPLDGGRFLLLFARAKDIPEFVEVGAVDVAVTGLDLVLETGCRTVRRMDLGFGFCRLVAAVPEGSGIGDLAQVKDGATIATSFPNLTRRFFETLGKKPNVITVSGATEITPTIGVADLITDLVETGSTLKKNHLLPVGPVILESQAVLIANEKALAEKAEQIHELESALKSVIDASRKRYLMSNVPKASLPEVRKILPGISGPTVMPLAGTDEMVAIHAVTSEDEINRVIPRLKALGGTGILVLPIERMVV